MLPGRGAGLSSCVLVSVMLVCRVLRRAWSALVLWLAFAKFLCASRALWPIAFEDINAIIILSRGCHVAHHPEFAPHDSINKFMS